MKQKVYFKTFGCRTNIYDTQIMKSHVKDFELVEHEADADIIVVNSCTVTNGADSNVRTYINTLNKENKRVLLAGCGSFSKGKDLYAQNKVHGVLGHSEKDKINTLLNKETSFFQLGDLDFVDKTIVTDYENRSRVFLKIQEGCSFNCSYCIIPSVRGKSRSQNEHTILEQVKRLAENGFGEFILTGINVGSYGHDTNTSVAKLMKKIAKLKGVRRIRLGSVEPSQIDAEFLELLDEPWLERHLHIALQHTHDEMLQIMRRRGSVKETINLFNNIAEKGFALGTDFITGHPGETEKIWNEAIENFKHYPLTHLHAFSYSQRDGTHAASLKMDVRGDIAKQRLRQINEIVNEKNYAFRKTHKNELHVLVEEYKNGKYIGYDQYFNKIYIDSKEDISKDWIIVNNYEVKKNGNTTTL